MRPKRQDTTAIGTAPSSKTPSRAMAKSKLARDDGSPLFAPTLPGGKAAGLHSIAGEEELLELGWRTRSTAAGTAAT